MSEANNVVSLRSRLPKTAAQADRIKNLTGTKKSVDIEITILPDRSRFREQRAWRILFGLYQGCTSIRSSKDFRKKINAPFTGKINPSDLPLFLQEAMPLVADHRAEVRIQGARLRRRLLDVMTA